MRADIHPKYQTLVATCSCGNVIETRSALGKETVYLDVCSACHPFYTGKQRTLTLAVVSTSSNNVLLACHVLSNATNSKRKKTGICPFFYADDFDTES